MPQYQLRNLGNGNSGVSLPRAGLEKDDLLEPDGDVPDNQTMDVDRLGTGVYLVRAVDGEVPDVRETDVVQNAVARELMERSAFDGVTPSAD